jgi:hypothetical membrane protein
VAGMWIVGVAREGRMFHCFIFLLVFICSGCEWASAEEEGMCYIQLWRRSRLVIGGDL